MSIKAAGESSRAATASQLNKMLEQIQKGYYNFCPSETWTPNVNLYETEQSYSVCVDLAGVDKDKIDLQVHGNTLTLRGNRAVPLNPDDAKRAERSKVHLMEIDHGAFIRQVELPANVKAEQITAVYRDGMLWVEIPKR